MRELLGMGANTPTGICSSFIGLVQCGGGAGSYKDGWGTIFYKGKGYRIFKDPQPSFNPSTVRSVQDHLIKPCSIVAHIRQASRGEVALEDTHPFTRGLQGRNWTHAHNGQLTGYRPLETDNFRLVGETDGEKASYWFLHKLTQRCPCTPDSMTVVLKYIAPLADELQQKGALNTLLSDGRYIMAYCLTNLH